MIPGMQILQACRREVLTLKASHQQRKALAVVLDGGGSVVKKKTIANTALNTFALVASIFFSRPPTLHHLLIKPQHFTLLTCLDPSSVASGGRSGSWPRADLLDTVNISSTTERLPDLPRAVRHHCSRVLHLMPDGVSAHNA